jgi:hypothetical protein
LGYSEQMNDGGFVEDGRGERDMVVRLPLPYSAEASELPDLMLGCVSQLLGGDWAGVDWSGLSGPSDGTWTRAICHHPPLHLQQRLSGSWEARPLSRMAQGKALTRTSLSRCACKGHDARGRVVPQTLTELCGVVVVIERRWR